MRAILFALLGLVAVTPAWAADKPAPGEGAPGTNVDMPVVIAPITVDGKLTGYAYISSRLAAATPNDALTVRDKIAFILDAFVRDVNRAPVTLADDPSQVDKLGVGARFVADATQMMGAGHVKNIIVTEVQIAPLHPKQTAMPDTPPPAAPPATPPAAPAKPAKTP